MIFSLYLVLLGVFLTGISQVLLKIGSQQGNNKEKRFLAAYMNIHTISAYVLLLFVTVIMVIALKEIPLKVSYAIASLTFVVVMYFSFALLNEKPTFIKIGATVLIMAGVILFNI